jgi:hypothetical protein
MGKKKSQVPLGLSLETRKLPRVRQVDPATCEDSEDHITTFKNAKLLRCVWQQRI